MNSTEKSLQRIYSYLTTDTLKQSDSTRCSANYLPVIVENKRGVGGGLDYSILLDLILESQESRQYQKCLSRLTLEILPPMLDQNPPLSRFGMPMGQQN